jgi:two-component sensor histidine kinase
MEGKSRTRKQLLDELEKSKQRISELEKKIAKYKENEILLREIHHRARNNMQIISSLLRLQERKLKNKNAREVLKISQNRIRSMALIHEKLHRSNNMAKIDLAQYIQDLAYHLFCSHGVDSNAIKLITGMENILLDVDRAVPFALIVNELLTNSLKHAFPNRKKGEIQIRLQSIGQEKFEFVVSDNGIGFPEDLDFRDVDSLGMKLVNTLVEQIEGNIQLLEEKGTSFKITF